MGVQRGIKYNGAIDRMKIKPEQTHVINGGQGILKVHNVFDEIPDFYRNADYVVVDPPWNRGNLKAFYTKADMELDREFEEFLDRLFFILKEIGVNSCYMEFGNQYKDVIREKMASVFDSVRVIDSYYYKTKPCVFVIGENKGHELVLEDKPKDELLVIEEIISKKQGTVLDFCLGRGAVSRNALKYGRKFIGTELNINRLAVSLEYLKNMGADIHSE